MKATELLHNLGQSLWLDNITREVLARVGDKALEFTEGQSGNQAGFRIGSSKLQNATAAC